MKNTAKGKRSVFLYTPTTAGEHTVNVSNMKESIGRSPYKVKPEMSSILSWL